jgi:hypothetical protein
MYWTNTRSGLQIGKADENKSERPWTICLSKRTPVWFAVLAVWMWLPEHRLSADGKVFPAAAFPSKVSISDQRALIYYTNGMERLVIETRFTGAGTNFAWVVPLPGEPVIEEASAGLFPTLQYLFQPRIIHDVPSYWPKFVALIAVAYLVLFVRRTGRLNGLDLVACLLLCFGLAPQEASVPGWILFGPVIFGPLLCGVFLVRRAKKPPLAIFGYAIVILFLLMTLLSAGTMATTRSKSVGPADQAISVLDRRLAGVYETTTLTSRDADSLLVWLRDNGFAASTNIQPVIESYLKDGWVFVAAKVRRNKSDAGASTPHPLSFTFKCDRPVYPTRLTGANDCPVKLELYVFGAGRATAPRFEVARCTRPGYPQPTENWSHWTPDSPQIVHPLLRKWVDGSPVATKLVTTQAPADMRRDVWIDWAPFSETNHRLFSRAGAGIWSLNLGAGILVAGLFVACAISWILSGRDAVIRRLPRLASCVALASIGIDGGIYFVLPKTEVRMVTEPSVRSQNSLYDISQELFDKSEAQWTRGATRAKIHEVVTLADTNAPYWKERTTRTNYSNWQNYLLGGPIREEDSPGNYIVRETAARVEFVAFDAQGAEHVLGDRPLRSPH